MQTKTAMVKEYVRKQYYKQALGICKDWRHPITKEESDTLRTAYECFHYGNFYRQLGRDPQEEINKAIEILKRLYL